MPGDLAASFIENIKEMSDWDQVTNIRKLRFTFAATEAAQFVERLRRMNLGFAALFPSLDGYAKSIGQHIVHYRKQADERAGLIP